MSKTDRTLGLILLEGLWAIIKFLAEVPGRMMELLLAPGNICGEAGLHGRQGCVFWTQGWGLLVDIRGENRLEVFNWETSIATA